MQLTKHFHLSEFARSSTAARLGIDNTIPEALIPNIRNLCEQILEPLRAHIRSPVVISSGYRCKALNKAVGGVWNSQHMTGEAADIVSSSPSPTFPREGVGKLLLLTWAEWIKANCQFDQLILEKSGNTVWLHVSCCRDATKNRKQVLIVTK